MKIYVHCPGCGEWQMVEGKPDTGKKDAMEELMNALIEMEGGKQTEDLHANWTCYKCGREYLTSFATTDVTEVSR
jgi:ribosomal protein S27E